MEYTKYNISTGEIIGNIFCDARAIEYQCFEDEAYIDGVYDSSYQIKDGIALKKELPYPEVAAYTFHDLIQYIDNDEDLDKAIINLGEDPTAYKLKHWENFRVSSYPPFIDYLDAQVKKHVKDKYEDGGDTQEIEYFNKCDVVKTRFPKE